MAVRWLAAKVPYREVEDLVTDLYGGENPTVAVEVFDHPNAINCTSRAEADESSRGVWLIGSPEEVETTLETGGFDWYETQLCLEPPTDD